jgi:hypothetical protein
MRRFTLLLTASLVLTLIPGAVRANWGRADVYETVYVGDVLATSYVLPTSYVIPTTYVARSYVATSAIVPTSYVYRPTSYVLSPTVSYVPTAYVATTWRSPLRRTTYVDYTPIATSYAVPTSYVVPTSYTVARSYTIPTSYYLPTSYAVVRDQVLADCCDTGVSVTSSAPVATQSVGASGQVSNYPSSPLPAAPPPSKPSNAITSQPRNGDSSVLGGGLEEPPLNPGEPAAPTPAPEKPETGGSGTASPPSSQPRDSFDALDPQASRRDSLRPAVTTYGPRTDLLPPGTLRVEVVSGLDGKAVSGARVVFSDARGRFPDRIATSNAQGMLTVNLPDGDWDVQIADTDPQKSLTFDRVTSSGGKFTDPTGRAILSLRLSR